MTGSIAVSQCGHTPNRPGHHGTVVAKTVGSVVISCNDYKPITFPNIFRDRPYSYSFGIYTPIYLNISTHYSIHMLSNCSAGRT